MTTTAAAKRVEKDPMGLIEVDDRRLWGAQTQRSVEHHNIGGERDRMPVEIIRSLALIKKCAAVANGNLGTLKDAKKVAAIVQAAQEVASGARDDEFPLSTWQSGSGTQSNMNSNEVIANLASEIMGGRRGQGRLVHPNDDVNLGQSTNDAFPTAIHVAAARAVSGRVLPAIARLRSELQRKSEAFADVVKTGRTHLMDATPVTLGQVLSGYVAQLDIASASISASLRGLFELAIGGTAVGTGLNAHPRFGEMVAAELAKETGLPFVCAPNRFAALAGHEAACAAHGSLRVLAVALNKIANDIRWLASGPRCGIGEIRIPENEPGSSIMPGKVNPTQCEAVTMVAAQVVGNDVALAVGAMSGNFELNVFKPLIARNLLHSCTILTDAMNSFTTHCVVGIEPDRRRIAEIVDKSLMLVTALAPRIGYDKAAMIAKKAHAEGTTLRESSVALGFVTAEQFDEWVKPSLMV